MTRPDDDNNRPEPRRAAIVGLVVILVLALAGYFLFTALRHNGELEDCLMSGRHNCAPIEAPSR